MSDEAVAWLREQIEGDKAVAQAAAAIDGPSWQRDMEDYDGEYPGSGAVLSATGEVIVYDEGTPKWQQAEHIALHDPRDVIADCEAKLAILDVHVPVEDGARLTCKVCVTWEDDPVDGETAFGIALPVAWPCMTLEITAAGYRHRDGYAEHWDAQACPSCGKPDVVLPLGHSLAIPMDGSAPACDVIPDPGPDIITQFLDRRRS